MLFWFRILLWPVQKRFLIPFLLPVQIETCKKYPHPYY